MEAKNNPRAAATGYLKGRFEMTTWKVQALAVDD